MNTHEFIVPLNEMFHRSERSSCFTPSTAPYFGPELLATPERGCSLSPGNSTQTCDSVGVPWLTGMGKVTLLRPRATCL